MLIMSINRYYILKLNLSSGQSFDLQWNGGCSFTFNHIDGFLNFKDTNNPMFRGESFIQILEHDVLVTDLRVPRAIEARGRVVIELNLAEPIVRQLVHETVEQRGGATRIHSELSVIKVVGLADTLGVFPFGDTYHPQELVDVVTRVTYDPAEYHEYVVYIQR